MRRLFFAALLMAPVPARALRLEKFYGPLGGGRPQEVVAEQVLVRFSTTAARAAALDALGAVELFEFPGGWVLVGLASGTPVGLGLAQLKQVSGVLSVEPNHFLRPNRTPSDALVPSQYALSAVNAFGAWEFEVGTSCRVTVAVLDAGIEGTQNDLSGKLAGVSQFFNPDNNGVRADNQPPTAACSHATRVASLAAASTDNGVGVAGMSWGAQLLSLKVFNDNDCLTDCADSGAGIGCGTTNTTIINALNHAVTLQNTAAIGKLVINISLGEAGACTNAVQTAVDAAVAAGIVIVGAAGNDGADVQRPGNCLGVIPVGATDVNNNVAGFSSRGAVLAAYGLVAPGVDVLVDDLNNGTASASGTSFAAPIVAGAAALILSAMPDLTPVQVRNVLRGGAAGIGVSSLGVPGIGARGNVAGAGRLDAFRSMRLAVRGTLSDYEGDRKAIAQPNPFHPGQSGHVVFSIPLSVQGAHSKIKVYTLGGELVRELNSTTWDGKNAEGAPVASGTYLFLATTSVGSARGRVVVIR